MNLFESRRKKFFRSLQLLFPVILLVLVCSLFIAGISRTSGQALQKEQDALEQALKSRFVVEYVPNGSNLLPSISVIALSGSRKGGHSS